MPEKEKSFSYVPLIKLWEEYLAVAKQPDVENFAKWILERQRKSGGLQKKDEPLNAYFNQQTETHSYAPRSSEVAFILWRLSKFIRYYTRPVLAENGLAGQDDFAILAHVDYKKSCSKKEAISANIIELTTGVEIIRRLIKQGLLTERSNPADGRERLISLTKAGQAKLYTIYQGFAHIQDVMADLTGPEREHLFIILKSLDDFHTRNYDDLARGMSG